MYSAIIAGFSLGLISNLHCIGMCGPLVIAVPISDNPTRKWIDILTYHLSRIFVYGILGLFIGMLGSQLSIWGMQQAVSIIGGVIILIYAISKIFKTSFLPNKETQLNKKITQWIVYFMSNQSLYSKAILGALNGLLPCGLVYIALAASLVYGNIFNSMAHMIAFGLGTFPSLILIMLFKHKMNFSLRTKINKLTPYFLGLVACILILRGMNLGLPYISPKLNDKHSCCEKVKH